MALQLYIDSKEVVLPTDFNVTLVYENPVYTKSGSYSYDITLSLLNPTNASLYKHINRINVKQRPQQKRSAYMLVDGRVLLRGTEVITENTDTTVTIMLVSGNSELNFLIGGDLNLRDLDLGRAVKLGGDSPNSWTLNLDWKTRAFRVFDDLQKKYPEVNHQLLPYATSYEDANLAMDTYQYYGNSFRVHKINHTQNVELPTLDKDTYSLIYYPYYSGEVPQPYLCFIIKQILKSLGYELTFSSLENDTIRSQIYIVHGFRTFQYAKMLPNWTVNDFFDYIEQWLNAVTIVNEVNKTVEFRYTCDTSNLGTVELEAVDEFEIEYPEDSTTDLAVTQSNIEYDFPDNEYYKYATLDKTLIDNLQNRSTKDKYNLGFGYHLLPQWVDDHRNDSDFFKYYISYNKYGQMVGVEYNNSQLNKKSKLLRLANFYPRVYNNADTEDINISFKIVPAAFIPFSIATHDDGKLFRALIQLPIAENHDGLLPFLDGGTNEDEYKDPEDEVIENISETIESESTTNENVGGSRLTVALYTGLQNCYMYINNAHVKKEVVYPISYCSPLVEYHYYVENNILHDIPGYDRNIFSLEYMEKDLYKKGDIINQSEIFKIQFIDKPNINILSTFIIKGRKFKCLKIERDLSHVGLQSIVKGEFYPIDS